MEDIVKVTRSLITNIFKKVRTALNDKADKSDLNKKADKNDVVLLEQIGEADYVAPLDFACKVPRENINENGWGILEVRDFDNEVDAEASSTSVWDYIIFDYSINDFLAHNPNNGKFYRNWANSDDYRRLGDNGFEPRQDRLFINTLNDFFMKWDGKQFVEVCVPTASMEKRIIQAALTGRNIYSFDTYVSANSTTKTTKHMYDILYVTSTDTYYYLNKSILTEIHVDDVNAGKDFMKFPTPIEIANIAFTPFSDKEGMINGIYKGETVGAYTKWYLIMKADTEDQTYTAGTSTNANYYKQSYTCYATGFNKPWELWLPATLRQRSVHIDW